MTDISELIPGPEAVIRYVRHQEERIAMLKRVADAREFVIKTQDESMNAMYRENVNLARKVDYYRLVTGLLIIALGLCILL